MITTRTAVRKRRPGKPRRGRVVDKNFLAFIATQPCLVSGRRPVTVHHVRRFGEPKNDRRTVPLQAAFHMQAFGATSIERLGKAAFEQLFHVDLEAAILHYNELYKQQRRAA